MELIKDMLEALAEHRFARETWFHVQGKTYVRVFPNARHVLEICLDEMCAYVQPTH